MSTASIESAERDITALDPRQQSGQSTADALSDEKTLELLFGLHSSLNIKAIITTFAQNIQKELPHISISYENKEAQFQITIGECDKHTFAYNLSQDHIELGEIKFATDNEFTQNEIQVIENYLCLLIIPLRNSVEHLKALQSALQDPLTGVANRAAMKPALTHDIEIAKRHDVALSILALDLDHFKKINDTYGHLGGDAYLQHVSQLMTASLRDSDNLYRIGGEEFVIILSSTDTAGAVKLAERIRKGIASAPCQYENQTITTSMSIGIASFIPGDTEMSLLERADQALYRAKQYGRNRVCT